MHKVLRQNTSLITRDVGNVKTMAPMVMLRLHFPQTAAPPGLCIAQVSGRMAVGPCPLLRQNFSSEWWETPAVLLLPFSSCCFQPPSDCSSLLGGDYDIHFILLLNC